MFGYVSNNKREGCKKLNIWKELGKISNVTFRSQICKDNKLLARQSKMQ